jgi:hypothetical protein
VGTRRVWHKRQTVTALFVETLLGLSTHISNSHRRRTLCGCGSVAIPADPSMDPETSKDYRLKGAGGCVCIDYDTIFDESPTEEDYINDSPCEKCEKRTNPPLNCEYDENGVCTDCTVGSYPPTTNDPPQPGEGSEPPHGILKENEQVLCSRMVIYTEAFINGGEITYDKRFVFRSRKRQSLPYFEIEDDKLVCRNAPRCDPGNKHTCCQCTVTDAEGNVYTRNFKSPGPYRECDTRLDGGDCESLGQTNPEFGGACFECTEKGATPVVPLKHMVTPCGFFDEVLDKEGNRNDEASQRRFIMGYEKIEEGWWFFGKGEFTDFCSQISEDDPFGSRKHTIVMHFEVRSRQIVCCGRHCPNYPEAGESVGCGYTFPPTCEECYNKIDSTCNDCARLNQYFKDEDKRHQQVRIVAAAGFTAECGFTDLQKLCDKAWDDSVDE